MDDDGTAYTWDAARRAFVPAELAAVGASAGTGANAAPPAYAPEDMTFPDEEEPPLPLPPPRSGAPGGDSDAEEEPDADAVAAELEAERAPGMKGKRARDEAVERERERMAAKKEQRAEKAKKPQQPKARRRCWFYHACALILTPTNGTFAQVNTSVYVMGLPDDATEEELASVFGKCGLIKEGDDGAPRVKLYRDKASNVPKGDGLVTYLKEPSVALAVTILDGSQFRPGQGQPMSVSVATFEAKPPGEAGDKDKSGRGGQGALPKKKRKAGPGGAAGGATEKALGWDGFDDVQDPKKVVVVLRGLFEPIELQRGGAAAVDELRAELQAECARFGPVDRARVFEYNPEGVATIKFREPAAADACRLRMHGRWFGGRQLRAALYDGKTDFNAGRPKQAGESEEEQAARLERYARELEAGGSGGGGDEDDA